MTGVLQRLPSGLRARLARVVPRLPVARPITERDSAYDVAHFERLYARVDPWGFEASPNDDVKYTLTLELCGPGPFARALEIGCSEGLFTRRLAPRCESLLAVDISTRAIRRARGSLAKYPGVVARTMTLPADYPAGSFDLIVASDVLYYWLPEDLWSAAPRIEDSLSAGGRFVAVHYALPNVGVSTGEIVHDLLPKALGLPHVHSERREIGAGRPYRIDVWVKGP